MRRAALPRWRATDNRWKKYFTSSECFFPQRLAPCPAIFLRKVNAPLSHAPKVSTTRGWKKMPWARHWSKFFRIFSVFRISIRDVPPKLKKDALFILSFDHLKLKDIMYFFRAQLRKPLPPKNGWTFFPLFYSFYTSKRNLELFDVSMLPGQAMI